MSEFLRQFQDALLAGVSRAAGEFLGWLLVLVLIIPLFLVIYLIMKKVAARRGVNLDVQWDRGPAPVEPPPEVKYAPELTPEPTPWITEARSPFLGSLDQTRSTLVKIYKALLLGVGIVLLSAAFYITMIATTANGLALVALVLFGAAIAAFSGMWKYDRRSRPALPPINVSVQQADPEVQIMDKQSIERARQLAQQGVPLDAICRQINPQYGQWGSFRQKAFEKLLESVLKHYSTQSPQN